MTKESKSNNNIDTNTTEVDTDITAQSRSDVGILYSTVIKITDPNSGEVLMHVRGDL